MCCIQKIYILRSSFFNQLATPLCASSSCQSLYFQILPKPKQVLLWISSCNNPCILYWIKPFHTCSNFFTLHHAKCFTHGKLAFKIWYQCWILWIYTYFMSLETGALQIPAMFELNHLVKYSLKCTQSWCVNYLRQGGIKFATACPSVRPSVC